MTSEVGQLIPASDFDTFVTAVTAVLGSASTGYGQQLSQYDAQVTGSGTETISHNEWDGLWTDIATCYYHQTGNTLGQTAEVNGSYSGTNLVKPASGTIITDNIRGQYAYMINLITTNKYNIANSQLGAQTSLNSATRSTPWNNTLTATITATFANALAANYFFNGGGKITVVSTNSGATPKDIDWQNLFSQNPIVINHANLATITGGSLVQLFSVNSTTYLVNAYQVQASYNSSTYTLTIVLNFEDNILLDNIDGNTVVTAYSYAPAGTFATTISGPTTTSVNFSGGTPVNNAYQYTIVSGGNTIYSVLQPGSVVGGTGGANPSVIQGASLTFTLSTPISPFNTYSTLYWRVAQTGVSNPLTAGDTTDSIVSGSLSMGTVGVAGSQTFTVNTSATAFTSSTNLQIQILSDSVSGTAIVLTMALIQVLAYPTSYTLALTSPNTHYESNPMFTLSATLNTAAVQSTTIPVAYTSTITGITSGNYNITINSGSTTGSVTPSGASATTGGSITWSPQTYTPSSPAKPITYNSGGSSISTYTMSSQPTITLAIATSGLNSDGKTVTFANLLQGSSLPTVGISILATASDGVSSTTITAVAFPGSITGTLGTGNPLATIVNGGNDGFAYSASITSTSANSATGNIVISFTVPATFAGIYTLNGGSTTAATSIGSNTYTISIPITITRIPSKLTLGFSPNTGTYQNTTGAILTASLDCPTGTATGGNVILSVPYTSSISGVNSGSFQVTFTSGSATGTVSPNPLVLTGATGGAGGTISTQYPGISGINSTQYTANDTGNYTVSLSGTNATYTMGQAGQPQVVFSVNGVSSSTSNASTTVQAGQTGVTIAWNNTGTTNMLNVTSLSFANNNGLTGLPVTQTGSAALNGSATFTAPVSAGSYTITATGTNSAITTGNNQSQAIVTVNSVLPSCTVTSVIFNGSAVTSATVINDGVDSITIAWNNPMNMGTSDYVNVYVNTTFIVKATSVTSLGGGNYQSYISFSGVSPVSGTLIIKPLNQYNVEGTPASSSCTLTIVAAPSYSISASPTSSYLGVAQQYTISFVGVQNRAYQVWLATESGTGFDTSASDVVAEITAGTVTVGSGTPSISAGSGSVVTISGLTTNSSGNCTFTINVPSTATHAFKVAYLLYNSTGTLGYTTAGPTITVNPATPTPISISASTPGTNGDLNGFQSVQITVTAQAGYQYNLTASASNGASFYTGGLSGNVTAGSFGSGSYNSTSYYGNTSLSGSTYTITGYTALPTEPQTIELFLMPGYTSGSVTATVTPVNVPGYGNGTASVTGLNNPVYSCSISGPTTVGMNASFPISITGGPGSSALPTYYNIVISGTNINPGGFTPHTDNNVFASNGTYSTTTNYITGGTVPYTMTVQFTYAQKYNYGQTSPVAAGGSSTAQTGTWTVNAYPAPTLSALSISQTNLYRFSGTTYSDAINLTASVSVPTINTAAYLVNHAGETTLGLTSHWSGGGTDLTYNSQPLAYSLAISSGTINAVGLGPVAYESNGTYAIVVAAIALPYSPQTAANGWYNGVWYGATAITEQGTTVTVTNATNSFTFSNTTPQGNDPITMNFTGAPGHTVNIYSVGDIRYNPSYDGNSHNFTIGSGGTLSFEVGVGTSGYHGAATIPSTYSYTATFYINDGNGNPYTSSFYQQISASYTTQTPVTAPSITAISVSPTSGAPGSTFTLSYTLAGSNSTVNVSVDSGGSPSSTNYSNVTGGGTIHTVSCTAGSGITTDTITVTATNSAGSDIQNVGYTVFSTSPTISYPTMSISGQSTTGRGQYGNYNPDYYQPSNTVAYVNNTTNPTVTWSYSTTNATVVNVYTSWDNVTWQSPGSPATTSGTSSFSFSSWSTIPQTVYVRFTASNGSTESSPTTVFTITPESGALVHKQYYGN